MKVLLTVEPPSLYFEQSNSLDLIHEKTGTKLVLGIKIKLINETVLVYSVCA